MKRILLIAIVSVLVLMAAGGITAVTLLSQRQETVEATKISFSETEIDILVGDTQELPLVKSKLDGEIKLVSSNSNILSIEKDGRIKAIDTIGNNLSRVYVTATNEVGEKAYLNVNVYNDVKAYVTSLGDGLYVVYRVYNKQDDTWRIAGISTRYQAGSYVDAPNVAPAAGYDMMGDWYESADMKASEKIVFQNRQIYTSYAVYAEEFLRDGSASVGGHIDLNVAYDQVNQMYVVTGLKYDYLKYETITIPKMYQYTKEDGSSDTVEIKGIANSAFERGLDKGDGKISNVGLQTLKKVDISYITHIGNNAFAQCHALETVVFGSGAITIAASAFDGTAYKQGVNA